MDGVDRKLDKLKNGLISGRGEMVTVTLTDDGKRRLPLPDVIPLLAGKCEIVDITGDGGEGSGGLVDLIRELISAPE